MIEFALEDKAEEIEKILKDYGVPLVQCSKCVVAGDLPAHGSYTAPTPIRNSRRVPTLPRLTKWSPKEKVEGWLADGADITQELSNAVIANDLDRVKFLVGKGADVNQADSQGWTPLLSAARQRHDDMIKLLIELGADVNLAKNDGTTPLIAAALPRPCALDQSALGAWRRYREAGTGRLPAAPACHRRGQIRGGQGADRSRREGERAVGRRSAHAADGSRGAERAGPRGHVPSRAAPAPSTSPKPSSSAAPMSTPSRRPGLRP